MPSRPVPAHESRYARVRHLFRAMQSLQSHANEPIVYDTGVFFVNGAEVAAYKLGTRIAFAVLLYIHFHLDDCGGMVNSLKVTLI